MDIIVLRNSHVWNQVDMRCASAFGLVYFAEVASVGESIHACNKRSLEQRRGRAVPVR
jgi:hypothetical protein